MIRIKIVDIDRHRNETTFRPYLMHNHIFRDVGIEFVFSGNSYDLAWVGQATYSNKKLSLAESVEVGIRSLEKIPGDVWLFDGQDSASLIGTYDVFVQSGAKFLLKNSLYKNRNDYKLPWTHGRKYWKYNPEHKWSITDNNRFSDVYLSGTNWLSTVNVTLSNFSKKKSIDVFALFSYPSRENYEFGNLTSTYYDEHRKTCVEYLNSLRKKTKLNIAMLDGGIHVPIDQYYDMMSKSKVVIAPFGYGEMAPRDLEAAMLGAILVKPDMSHIESLPEFYSSQTYIPVKWDFSDLQDKIQYAIEYYKDFTYPEQALELYLKETNYFNGEMVVSHICKLLKQTGNFNEVN